MKGITLTVGLITMIINHSIAQWSISTLDTARLGIASAVVGSKALFAGGYQTGNTYTSEVVIYDDANAVWSTQALSLPNAFMSSLAVNDKAIFVGTNTAYSHLAEIYNATTNTWSSTSLVGAVSGIGTGVVGSKAFFAGGNNMYALTNRADIYNDATGIWTAKNLSQARTNIAVATVSNKIVFAGGVKSYTRITSGVISQNGSTRIDIYDNGTNTWSIQNLSLARILTSIASVGNKMLVAGGGVYNTSLANGTIIKPKNTVDIYDAVNNTMSTATLSTARHSITSAVVGNKVLFAGGLGSFSYSESNVVDIYDNSTGTWSVATMSEPKYGMAVVVIGNHVYFSGGRSTVSITNKVEIYDASTNTWSVDSISEARFGICAATVGNKAIFAGGRRNFTNPIYYSNVIDIYSQTGLRLASQVSDNVSSNSELKVYPNPFVDKIQIQLPNFDAPATISIFDITGKLQNTFQIGNVQTELNLVELRNGIYLLQINREGKLSETIKIIKE